MYSHTTDGPCALFCWLAPRRCVGGGTRVRVVESSIIARCNPPPFCLPGGGALKPRRGVLYGRLPPAGTHSNKAEAATFEGPGAYVTRRDRPLLSICKPPTTGEKGDGGLFEGRLFGLGASKLRAALQARATSGQLARPQKEASGRLLLIRALQRAATNGAHTHTTRLCGRSKPVANRVQPRPVRLGDPLCFEILCDICMGWRQRRRNADSEQGMTRMVGRIFVGGKVGRARNAQIWRTNRAKGNAGGRASHWVAVQRGCRNDTYHTSTLPTIDMTHPNSVQGRTRGVHPRAVWEWGRKAQPQPGRPTDGSNRAGGSRPEPGQTTNQIQTCVAIRGHVGRQ